MIDHCRPNLCLFNPTWIKEASGTVVIEERETSGAGSAEFTSTKPCVVIRAEKQAPLIWSLAQRKCADGAILSFDEHGAHLHLVELKSKINLGTWAHALQQLEGMYLSAIAVSRLLQIAEIQSVTCYIAGSIDKVTGASTSSASPALLKSAVGRSATFGGLEAWTSELISLPFGVSAVLKKSWKNDLGVVSFGQI